MVYIYGNIFFAKKDFTFGLRTVKFGEIQLIQTMHVPMLIYELPASSLKCRAQPNVIRRSFEPYDQMLYQRTILEPHMAYPIPAGTKYIVLTVQKTTFGLDIIPESLLPQLIQKGFHVGDFRKMKKFDQTTYKLPPPTPIHVPAEMQPSEEKFLPFSKRRVRIIPVMRRVSRRPELPMAPGQIQPVQIPFVTEPHAQIPEPPVQIPQSPVQIPDVREPPVQIPHVPETPVQIPHVQIPDIPEHVQIPKSQVPQPHVQIPYVPEPTVQILHVPEPMQIPPELYTLELDPLEPTDALDQLMSFVFGPPAQELQLHTVPSIFYGDLISFLDEFERELAAMDLTMPRRNPCVNNLSDLKPSNPWICLSIVACSKLYVFFVCQ
ncbi:uncharacterized protein TNCV_1137971 [Trichonephila clavipes]|nr:uncharacterized protein TNCV_1137971 [Trichonephila clavipes]